MQNQEKLGITLNDPEERQIQENSYKIFSFQLQVSLSMCDLFVTTRH